MEINDIIKLKKVSRASLVASRHEDKPHSIELFAEDKNKKYFVGILSENLLSQHLLNYIDEIGQVEINLITAFNPEKYRVRDEN